MAGQTVSKTLAVIPARFASTRFPGKVIAPLAGKPLVAHTYEQARKASLVRETVVAADDERVAHALAPFNIPVVMTRPDHPSGTDRIAEVAAERNADVVVNVQGDEPLIDPLTIDEVIRPLLDDPSLNMATVRRAIDRPSDVTDPNVVKVVCDQRGRALYFSRSPIPYVRDKGDEAAARYWRHYGLYAYRRDFLLEYAKMAPTPLEMLEKLEQLRALENGFSIAVVETVYDSIGVDTPADLARVAALLENMKGKR